ncbi:MAG: NADH-quinone oxidoreductase subunit L [Ardenticatenales bacterium]|nr:NADH-quinone oxidoreductase subunit L [Ardenticatenales bacterium]
MSIETLLPWVPALPLIGFVTLVFFGRRLGGRWSGIVATVAMGAAFAVAAWLALGSALLRPGWSPPRVMGIDEKHVVPADYLDHPQEAVYHSTLWTWMTVAPQYDLTVVTRPVRAGEPVPADAVTTIRLPQARITHDLELFATSHRMFTPEQAIGRIARLDLLPIGPDAPLNGDRLLAETTLLPDAERAIPAAGLPERPLGYVVDVALQLDALSLLMILIVTGVGFLIHLYSIGYMAHDADRPRYFAYLNLFAFSMLTLVLGANFLVLFVGWELVGACSYLLIGFWHKDPANASAGRKAFIVNRIGDVAFLIAMMLIFTTFGSLAFADVLPQAADPLVLSGGVATLIAALLLVGATGKSAQIPLYVWLPDAMAGPTPVSALIHAATMVTAGIYMMARAHVIFDHAPSVLVAVAVVGAVTAFGAALIALVQSDIKRVLAYSTVSQLGYMFLGVGAGAYASGVFHLMTHAFFKALLFLGAGSLMHAMEHGFHHGKGSGHGAASSSEDHDDDAFPPGPPPALDGIPPEQDLRHMGGLLRKAPVTGWTFVVGGLALAGVFPLAGFWSKDEILHHVIGRAGEGGAIWLALFALGLVTAGLTAFYTGRLLLLALFGAPRSSGAAHAADSPRTMTAPLVVLAALSIVGGLPWLSGPLAEALDPVLRVAGHVATNVAGSAHAAESGPSALTLALIASAVALGGLALAWAMYRPGTPLVDPARLATAMGGAYRTLRGKFYVDELYAWGLVRPFTRIADFLWHRVDDGVVDAAVNAVGRGAVALGQGSRRWQTGYVRTYGLGIVIGAAALAAWLLWLV